MVGYVNRVAFELFDLPIYWYAVIIISGVVIAMVLSSREAERVGMKADDVTDFMLVGLPLSFIGARFYYILFDLQPYLADPIQVFNIRSGGLAIYGGLIVGAIWLYYFCSRHFISMWTFLDIAAPSVMIAQSIGRWGNFMNHEAFGGETTRSFLESLHLPQFIIENMNIDGAYRQPTFLYESLWTFIGFIVLVGLRKKTGLLKQGEVALSYVIWYSFGRMFIEGMRTDSLYLFGDIRVSQLLSFILLISAIGVFIWRRRHNQSLKSYDRSHWKNQWIV
ncbi:prolipoprotein diacylglyceryl transferase [Enterococcus bulliens]